ncbi:MAG TPA: metalloregulator ArsR/SmtB family transcription factor [Trebonia sp.]|nr:metalloregulator ArsR/SmtB family transcription factor [Trebonia sp.]
MESLTDGAPIEVFRAIGDPVRWSIIVQLAAVDELPCAELEQTLPVSKPTISYHAKTLQQAGLLAVRKEGRNYFYALRRDVLQEALDQLGRLAPPEGAATRESVGQAPVTPARRLAERPVGPVGPATSQRGSVRRKRRTPQASDEGTPLLTW